MPPADLAIEVIDTARQHVEETNERKNYRVVGLRRLEGENGDEEQEEIFHFLLPATLFGAVGADPATASDTREHHDALMAANQQLQRQNELLFRMLMEVVRQYPAILSKSTELLEQLGDQLGGGRQHDLQQVLSILEFESSREQRWMEHDRAKQRSSQRAEMFGKSIDLAGPDLMLLLRKLFETLSQQAASATEDETASEEPRGHLRQARPVVDGQGRAEHQGADGGPHRRDRDAGGDGYGRFHPCGSFRVTSSRSHEDQSAVDESPAGGPR